MPPETAATNEVVAANSSAVAPAAVIIDSPPAIEAEAFLQKIHAQLLEAPAALAPNQTIKIELRAHEVGYFYATLKRLKAAEARQQRAYYKRFKSLDALMKKEENRDPKTDPKPFISEPPGQSNPECAFEQSRFKEALLELPEHCRKLAAGLVDAEGNVSELARRIGQPQRKTARQVDKLRRLLREKGLESLEF